MRHSRQDYQNRIVDLAGIIPDHEPVFLLRAQDNCALAAIHSYLTELVNKGASRDIVANVNATILSFSKFVKDNPAQMKIPNIGEPKDLPVADSPILQKALNDVSSLTDRNAALASSLEKVTLQLDEYAGRYSELKKLQEATVEELDRTKKQLQEALKQGNERGHELTELKFDFSKEKARSQNLMVQNEELLGQVNRMKTLLKEGAEQIETLTTALKNEKDSNAI